MIEFLKDQPAEARDQIMDLLASEVVECSLLLALDFAKEPLFLSNRNLPFQDLKWGREWGAGAGLLVSVPNINGGDEQLAPFSEYKLGLPNEWIDGDDWAAQLVEMRRDVSDYRGRDAGQYIQFFEDGQPVGYPVALSVGFMDTMSVSFPRGGAIVTLTVEGFLARKGAPVYGMQTYLDQQRRYPGDKGFEFVVEAGNLIVWTDW